VRKFEDGIVASIINHLLKGVVEKILAKYQKQLELVKETLKADNKAIDAVEKKISEFKEEVCDHARSRIYNCGCLDAARF
jgi:aspartyl/asparaginyl-tRNA synthetase